MKRLEVEQDFIFYLMVLTLMQFYEEIVYMPHELDEHLKLSRSSIFIVYHAEDYGVMHM